MSRFTLFFVSFVLTAALAACTAAPRGPKPPEPVTPTAEEENQATLALLRRFDTDRDGVIACADRALQQQQLFAKIDKDGDGKLVGQEYRFAAFDDSSYQFYAFANLDDNLDGFIDFTEFSLVSDNNYRRLDRDGDCTVSRAEIIEASQGYFRAIRAAKARKGKDNKAAPVDFDEVIELEELPDEGGRL